MSVRKVRTISRGLLLKYGDTTIALVGVFGEKQYIGTSHVFVLGSWADVTIKCPQSERRL